MSAPAPYTAADVVTAARLTFLSPSNIPVCTAGKIALAVFDVRASA